MSRRYFYFWILFLSLVLISPPNISAVFCQVENDKSYTSDGKPPGEIVLAQNQADWRRRKQIEQQRRLEAQKRQRQIEQQRRLEAQRRQRQIEQQKRLEAQRRQRQIEQQKRLEAQKRQRQIEQQRRLEAQKRQRQIEQQRQLQVERRRRQIERQRLIQAEIARRALERQRHLEAERWRLAGERERRLEEERLKREEERQMRLEEEKWQKEEERRSRLDEERLKKEEERQMRLEEEKWQREMEREERLEREKWRREEERERRQEAARLKLEEEKWKKEEEHQIQLEEKKWRREEALKERLKAEEQTGKESEKKVVKKQSNSFSLFPKTKVSSSWRAAKNTRILAVAVGNFKDNSIQQASNAATDAKYFASFANSSGIPKENITCLTDDKATRNEITDALIKLKMATTEKTETAIVYFSGHGAPIMKNGKIVDSVIVPYDAKGSSMKLTGIKMSTLREILSDVRGKWIVILDSCFSGKSGRSLMPEGVKALAVVPKDFNIVPKSAKNTWWVTATSGDNYANSFPKKNLGLFTYYFMEALNGKKEADSNGDGLISLREAFTWTDSEVKSVSRKSLGRPQDPEIIGEGDTVLTILK